jgi:hypothetical protein
LVRARHRVLPDGRGKPLISRVSPAGTRSALLIDESIESHLLFVFILLLWYFQAQTSAPVFFCAFALKARADSATSSV